MEYPQWSEISTLIERLRERQDMDSLDAAIKLEDLQARLHNRTGDLDVAERRLSALGYLIERLAVGAQEERIGPDLVGYSISSSVMFELLHRYRSQSEGKELYEELRLPREIAGITTETVRTLNDWLGQASTREAAEDALRRLSLILERAGLRAPRENLRWRGQIIRAMEEAGVGIGEDGAVRVRRDSDKHWESASGPLVRTLLAWAEGRLDALPARES